MVPNVCIPVPHLKSAPAHSEASRLRLCRMQIEKLNREAATWSPGRPGEEAMDGAEVCFGGGGTLRRRPLAV